MGLRCPLLSRNISFQASNTSTISSHRHSANQVHIQIGPNATFDRSSLSTLTQNMTQNSQGHQQPVQEEFHVINNTNRTISATNRAALSNSHNRFAPVAQATGGSNTAQRQPEQRPQIHRQTSLSAFSSPALRTPEELGLLIGMVSNAYGFSLSREQEDSVKTFCGNIPVDAETVSEMVFQMNTETPLSRMSSVEAQEHATSLTPSNPVMTNTAEQPSTSTATQPIASGNQQRSEGPKTLEELQDENMCKICFTEELSIILMQCHHLMGEVCSKRVQKCPTCRAKIDNGRSGNYRMKFYRN